MTGNLSASILARLLTLAKKRGDDYSLLLNRFALERLLARVSMSPHADRFLLKGALLFALWYDTPHRPTRDADLLGFGPDDEANLIATFREVATMNLGDGIVFDPESVKADAIREDNTYGGTRITLVAHIGGHQLDVAKLPLDQVQPQDITTLHASTGVQKIQRRPCHSKMSARRQYTDTTAKVIATPSVGGALPGGIPNPISYRPRALP